MKKILYSVVLLLFLLVLADRLLKIYENREARRSVQKACSRSSLSAQQVRDYDAALQFRLVPYTVFGLKPNFNSETVNINSLGLRGREIKEKGPHDYRIVVLGGSAVFGAEASKDDLTFCKLLERKLRAKVNKEIEVINAGLPAYISMQELILFEDKIIDLKPDLVIVFDGFNDILTILKREKRPNYPWWFSEIERIYYTSVSKLFIEKRLRKYRPTKWFLKWTEGKKKMAMKYEAIPAQIDFYERNLDLVCHLAKSYGIDAIVIFQPVLLYKKPLAKAEEKIIDGLEDDYVKALKEMCDLGRKAAEGTAVKNKVDFIDGTEFFNGLNDPIFLDEAHFNQKGHEIVADLLSDKIETRLKSSPL